MLAKYLQSPLFRYMAMYKTRWHIVALCMFLALVQSAVLAPIFLFYKKMIDHSIPNNDFQEVLILGLIAAGLYLFHLLLSVLVRYLTLNVTKAVIYELRSKVCTKLQELALSYYDNTNVGMLHSRAMIDTEQVDVASNGLIVYFGVSVMSFAVALVILLKMNIPLTLVLLSVLPMIYLNRYVFKNRLEKAHTEFQVSRESLSIGIHDLVNTIRLVKSFGMEPHEEKKINNNIRDYLQIGTKRAVLSSLFGYLINFAGSISLLAVWVVGAWMAINGRITTGSIIAFAGLQAYLIGPINQMASYTEVLYSGNTSLKAIFELLDEDDVEILTEDQPAFKIKGHVTFDNVVFEYKDGTRALNGVSLSASPGQQIALVGESGAGKSTLIHVILGLYMPQSGRVLIDGQDLAGIDLRSLRQQMGVVSQETILINGTVRENIAYGTPGANDELIYQAAIQANAHEFITRLPNSYDSFIGEDGIKLSGGQRQRIAIARAFLRDPRILILDEATSSLDSESEMQIQKAMELLRQNRTTFVIAHRLSTILASDVILVLKDGKIVERGTHLDLLEQNGVYSGLYNTQFRHWR
ncbi:MAG: ABC transporter ATP-binding protein [Armatimonadota bacterium]